MYAIVATWDGTRVGRHNWVSTEEQAKHIVDRLNNVELGDDEKAEIEEKLRKHKDPKDPMFLSANTCIHCENRLKPLPAGKQTPGAYYVQMPDGQGDARYWGVDSVAKTVTYDVAARLTDEHKRHDEIVTRECEDRIAGLYYPDNPAKGSQVMAADGLEATILQDKGRDNWDAAETGQWDAITARRNAAKVCRDAAKSLIASASGKTQAEIRNIKPRQDKHWSE